MKLELLEIPKPCQVPWESMKGDDRVRHCMHCHLDVYDLSALTRDEAERFLESREGVCVTLLKRHDGTVVTQDCATERSATPRPCATPATPHTHAAAPSRPTPPAGDPPAPTVPATPPPPVRLGGAPMPMPRMVLWESADPRVGRGTLLADAVRAIRAALPVEEVDATIAAVERALEVPAHWKTASCAGTKCPLWVPGGPDPVPQDFLQPRTQLLEKIDPAVRAAFDPARADVLLREVKRTAFAGSRGVCPHCHSFISLPPVPPPKPPVPPPTGP